MVRDHAFWTYLLLVQLKIFSNSQIKNAALYWKDSLVKIIEDEGIDNNRAILLSEEIIISIEGALVFARATGDFESFNRALENILLTITKNILD